MPQIVIVTAAASFTVGTNLLAGNQFQTGTRLRRVRAIALVGGNAVAEAEVELMYGGQSVGRFRNSKAGAAQYPIREDFQEVDPMVGNEPGEPLNLFVRVAATVNQVVTVLDVEDLGR